MDVKIDRSLATAPRQQLRALLVQRIASGGLVEGAPLPSVRDLAERAGVAPMTVSRVYAEMKAGGLIETRTGAGTFVASSALSHLGRADAGAALRAAIDATLAEAAAHGIGLEDVLSMMTARAAARAPALRVMMVGLFAEATRSYAARVAAQIGAPVGAIALADEAPDEDRLAARLAGADLVLTFADLHPRLARVVPEADLVSLRFIPAEGTRRALAGLDPRARVVAVSRFDAFLPILTLGVRRFASHVRAVTACVVDAPDLPALLAGADVVVMSTGAEGVAAAAPPGATLVDYLHVPDPGDVDRLVVPRLVRPGPDARKEAS